MRRIRDRALPVLCGALLLLVIPAHAQDAAQAEKDFAFAEGLYGQENYELAVQKYLAFIEAYPQHPNLSLVLFRAGECNFRLGRYPEAAPWFEQVTTRFPDSEECEPALLWLGDARFKAGQYEPALTAYEALLAKFPDGRNAATAAYWRGESYYQLARYEEAARAYEDAIARGLSAGDVPYAIYSIGLSYLLLERPADAAAQFTRVVREHPNSPVAAESQYLLARALQRQGETEQALAAYQAVAANHAASSFAPQALMGVANCHFQAQRYDQALEAYRRIAAEYPTSELAAEAKLRVGDSLFHLQRWDETVAAYEPVSGDAQSKWAPDALYWLAVTRERQGQPEAALAAHQRLIERFPQAQQAADAWLHIGRLKAAAGDVEGAVAAYATAAERATDPGKRHEALVAAQWARYRQAQSPEALEELAASVRADPAAEASAELAYRVGRAQFDAGRYEPAMEMLTLLTANHPQAVTIPEARYLIAVCQERLGRPEEAQRLYAEIAAAHGDSEYGSWATSALAGMHASAGEVDQAKQLLTSLERAKAPAGAIGFAAYRIADALRTAERTPDAIGFYEKSLQADPQGESAPWALVGLGWCRKSEPEQALASFERVLAEFADSPARESALQGMLAVGQAAFEAERYDEARQAWQRVLDRGADGATTGLARYGLAWVLLRQNQPEQALEPFLAAAQAPVPGAVGADARYQAARLLAEKQQHERVVELLEPLRATPGEGDGSAWALTLLGEAYLAQNRPQEAAAAFEAVTTRWPEHDAAPGARLGQAKSFRLLGRNPDALAALRAVGGQGGARVAAETQYELGLALQATGDAAGAAEELLKVAILYPQSEWSAAAQFAAGQCYEQLGQAENAIRSYRVIERQYADQAQWAQKAAERLRALGQ